MIQRITLKLAPAQLYYLRELVRVHADCRQHGWAILKQVLDEHWMAAAQRERTYGPVPQQDFLDFKEPHYDDWE